MDLRFTLKSLGFLGLSVIALFTSHFLTANAQTATPEQTTTANQAKDYVIRTFNSLGGAGLSSSADPQVIVSEFIARGGFPSCTQVTRNNGSYIWECAGEMSSEGTMANYDVKWYPGDRMVCTFASMGQESTILSVFTFGNRLGARATDRAACIIARGSASGNPGGFFYYYNRVPLANGGGAVKGEFRANNEVIPESVADRGTLENIAVEGAGAMVEDAVSGVARLIFTFSTWLLGIAGALFNWIIVKGVFQFSLLIGNSPGLLAAWSILRDLGNILLLFGFIFIGVSTILGTGKFGDKKAIPKLLIFALLMNFSLFAAEAVIDSANLLASTMYNQASETSRTCVSNNASTAAQGTGEGAGGVGDCAYNYGISGHIIQSSGLASTYAADNPALQPAIMVGLAAFVTVGAVLLFSASFMLITRAVMLTFLMITSPIGFAGMALPPMQKFAKQWWAKLIHQAFYAPILLLMIFISLKITDSFTSGMVGERNLAAALQNPLAANMGILLVFALVVGFLVASITAAKKFGMAGADFALNVAKMPYRFAGRAALGATAVAGRQTIGRGATNLSAKVRRSNFGATESGRRLAGFLDRGGKASFDVRGIKGLRDASKKAGLDVGGPSKSGSKGFAGQRKDKDEARKKYAESLDNSDREDAIKDLEAEEKREKELNEKNLKDIKERKAAREKLGEKIDADIAAQEKKVAEDSTAAKRDELKKRADELEKEAMKELSSGNTDKAVAAANERKAVQNELKLLEDRRKLDQQELETLKQARKNADDTLAADIEKIAAEEKAENDRHKANNEKIQEKLDSTHLKRRYANNIGKTNAFRFMNERGRKKTAKAIRDKVKKSPKDKIAEALKDLENDSKDKKDSDKEGDKG